MSTCTLWWDIFSSYVHIHLPRHLQLILTRYLQLRSLYSHFFTRHQLISPHSNSYETSSTQTFPSIISRDIFGWFSTRPSFPHTSCLIAAKRKGNTHLGYVFVRCAHGFHARISGITDYSHSDFTAWHMWGVTLPWVWHYTRHFELTEALGQHGTIGSYFGLFYLVFSPSFPFLIKIIIIYKPLHENKHRSKNKSEITQTNATMPGIFSSAKTLLRDHTRGRVIFFAVCFLLRPVIYRSRAAK